MFKIVRKHSFTDDLFLLEIEVPSIAGAVAPGQYVDISINPDAATQTLPVVDRNPDAGTVTVLERARDLPSEQLMMLQENDELFQVRGPFGATCQFEGASKVLLAGEGLGVASLYGRAKAFRERGAYTICIIGFETREQIYWQEEFAAVCDELYVATEDGSYGVSGKLTVPLRAVCETHKDVERMVIIAELKNMKRAVKMADDFGVKAHVSFDAIRTPSGTASVFDVNDNSQDAFAFARAAELDGGKVDFDKLIARQRAMRESDSSASTSGGA